MARICALGAAVVRTLFPSAKGAYDLVSGPPLARGHGFQSLHGSRVRYGPALTLVLVVSAFPQNVHEDEIPIDGLSYASNCLRW
jgi:hypothetical protein